MTHRPFWVCCEASWGSLVTLGDSVVSWRPLSTVKFPHASRLLWGPGPILERVWGPQKPGCVREFDALRGPPRHAGCGMIITYSKVPRIRESA